jgi:hypothetical protein
VLPPGREPAEAGGLEVVPPPLTPPVDVTSPALLPPEPDGELLELQASSENAAREKALRKSRVRQGFLMMRLQCNATSRL